MSIAALLCILSPQFARAVSPTPAEMAEARRWAAAKFEGVADGKEHRRPPRRAASVRRASLLIHVPRKAVGRFPQDWRTQRVSKKLNDGRTARTTTYTDPATGLEVRCDAVEYSDYPAVEWILHFKNTGKKDTGIIENILPMDLSLTRGSSEFVVHHAKGSCCNIADFQPIDDVLAANAKLQIQSSPWPSTTALPFFNVECDGHGTHRGHRLDGGLGGQLYQGRGKVAFREGGAEPRALRPPSRRRGPKPADARPLLERRPDARPQSLASTPAEAL